MKIRPSWALLLGLPGWNKLTKVYVYFKLVKKVKKISDKITCPPSALLGLDKYTYTFLEKKVKKISDKITCPSGPPGPSVYVFLLGGV